MFKQIFITFCLFLTVLLLVDARNINLREKELHNIGVALSSAINNHVDGDKFQASGHFNLEANSDDIDVSVDIDVSTSETQNGVLSGNDVLNGLANGNGANNGNHNGNVILQIFNIPVDDDHIIRIPTNPPTTPQDSTTWYTTGTWYTTDTTGATTEATTPEVWWTTTTSPAVHP